MADFPRSILVVEDHTDIADSIREILEDEGYVVHTSGTATEALDMFQEVGHLDVILLDVKLPDMSGSELLKVLEDFSQFDTPVVVMTAGKETPPNVHRVLRKPFELDALLSTVRELCT